jgi:CBS domain-containing protein
MKLMSEKRCRHLPVMEGEKIIGMVSTGDLTHYLAKNQEKHITELVNYISGGY